MNIVEVNTTALIKQFLKLPSDIYKKHKYWTIQLGTDIEHVFCPAKNSMFINGDAKRWVVYDEWKDHIQFQWVSPSLTPGLVRLPHQWS